MAVRDKTGLAQRITLLNTQITTLIDSGGEPRISAADLRSVLGDVSALLTDLVDSLDLMAAAEGQALVDRINTALGGPAWQQPAGMTTGVTLAQALAAIMVDDTPVDHIHLTIDRSNPAQVTIGLASVAAQTHTRYASFTTNVLATSLTEMEWLAGETSETETIMFPRTTANHKKGFAIPATAASLTDIRVVGSPFNSRNSYNPAVGAADVLLDIGGEAHKTYVQIAPDFGGPSATYQLR